jgi:hypothetical protein
MSLSLSFPDVVYSSSNKPSTSTLKADLTSIETEVNSHEADATIHFLANTLYPVGSVFLSVLATSPATLLGFGTWARIAEGQMLTGFKTGDSDFGTLEATGGAKTKTITQANLPNVSVGNASATHTHSGTTSGQSQTHTHKYGDSTANVGQGSTHQSANNNSGYDSGNASVDHTHTVTTGTESATHAHSLGGSGTALDVINPFFVIYAWKRTA